MMNYQEMSDFEINCRVHFRNYDKLRFEKGKFYYSDRSGREMVIGKYLYKFDRPDYCNSWADAGPIIQENKIPLNPFRGEWVAGERRNVKDKNPLRAAMIVFLMMKGGE
ncbi:phage protein NinX family protein [Rosenbergiella epipactidis]|uniref:phage protein NinX family protein n=1 Tax=Rosenbergiella epipactidis TaxID=1544694 RepID=UPI001F4E5A03|nr:phage protein NinX family protein [Rosenbergiella epipactidis]